MKELLMKRLFDRAFVMYCVTGFLNYLFCTTLMFLLYHWGVCTREGASFCNIAIGGVIWFIGCQHFVFPGQPRTAGLILRFVLEILTCYALSYLILAPALVAMIHGTAPSQADSNIVMATGSVLYSILNYIGQRFFVFCPLRRTRRHNHTVA